jgi:hypothetical protein
MIELSGVLGNEALVEIAAVANNLLLDAWGASALAGEGLSSLSLKVFELSGMHVIGALDERRTGVVPEHETHASLVPAIEMRTHREIGVAAQESIGKSGASAELDRLVAQLALASGTDQRAVGIDMRRFLS